jgi:hypothetical protein
VAAAERWISPRRAAKPSRISPRTAANSLCISPPRASNRFVGRPGRISSPGRPLGGHPRLSASPPPRGCSCGAPRKARRWSCSSFHLVPPRSWGNVRGRKRMKARGTHRADGVWTGDGSGLVLPCPPGVCSFVNPWPSPASKRARFA